MRVCFFFFWDHFIALIILSISRCLREVNRNKCIFLIMSLHIQVFLIRYNVVCNYLVELGPGYRKYVLEIIPMNFKV